MKKSVLGIGNALVDILTRIEDDEILNRLNLPKGSMQIIDENFGALIGETLGDAECTMSPGGSAANTIHGLAKLGIGTGFICCTGNDEIGAFFENSMKSVGVKPITLKSEKASGTARAIVSADGERTFATNLGAAVEIDENILTAELLQNWGYCYIEGYLIPNRSLVKKAIKTAKENGCKVVIDLASYNVVEENRDFLMEILPDIDIVFANEEEAKSLTMTDAEASLDYIASKVEIAVVKVGKKGSLIRRGEETVSIACNDVKVIDTTGAGDLYAAGFLYGLINGYGLERCGTIGNLLAESIIQVMGAKMNEDDWTRFKEISGI